VILERLREADWVSELLTPARPALRAWWEQVQARPSHRTAMTDRQHPRVRSGTARLVAEKARNAAFRRALYGAEDAG